MFEAYDRGWEECKKSLTKTMYTEEEVAKITKDFFYFWYNAPGNNTEEGFEKWFAEQPKKELSPANSLLEEIKKLRTSIEKISQSLDLITDSELIQRYGSITGQLTKIIGD